MPDKILLVTPASPFRPQSGAQQRSALLYAALTEIMPVDVLLLAPAGRTHVALGDEPNIRALATWRAAPLGYRKFAPDRALNRQLTEYLDLADYRLVVGRYLNPICKLARSLRRPALVDLDDWAYRYPHDRGAWSGVFADFKTRYARLLAERQLSRFSGFFFTNEGDRVRYPELTSEVLPNIPYYVPPVLTPQYAARNILFVGSLWYAPNYLGIDSFLSGVWPQILRRLPDATLTLVGPAAAPRLARWREFPRVACLGFREDLASVYRDAALTIAPIHSGGGTAIKVLESLAFGRVCVLTNFCFEGFRDQFDGDSGLVVGADDGEFASRCIELLREPALRARLVERGQRLLARAYSRAVFTARVRSLVERV